MAVLSKEVIVYLKKSLNKKFYASMFVGGSMPKELIAQSDLDIFIVMKNKHRGEFFNNLVKIMDKFMKDKDKIVYSFYRGPLKYKNKGLIHFIIYSDVVNSDFNTREQFVGESRPVLKSLVKTAKVISGESLESLTKDVDWADNEIVKKDVDGWKRKLSLLQEKNKILYPQWTETKNGWKLLKSNKYVSKFFKDELIRYYVKNIKKVEHR